MSDWLEAELSGCEFKDKRLGDRFKKIVKALASGSGQSIPEVCEDWALTKSVYRFLSNERVDEAEILAGHFLKTQERMLECEGPVLVLHDTTEFSYSREHPERLGYTRKLPTSERVRSAFGELRNQPDEAKHHRKWYKRALATKATVTNFINIKCAGLGPGLLKSYRLYFLLRPIAP